MSKTKATTRKTARKPTARVVKAKVPRILNCLPSRDREQDWPAERAFQANARAAVAVPASKDLRESWWSIGNQGSTGSCVGWATADSVLRWHFVNNGLVTKTQKLSVRYLWMAAKETDEFNNRPTTFIDSDGTSLKAALTIVRQYGIVTNDELPWGSGSLYPGETSTFYAIASLRRIASYFALSTNVLTKIQSWRKWLSSVGPILTRLDVDSTWMNVASSGQLTKYKANTTEGGHAVAIVGYTPEHFIVRNSWGTGWGDKGYAYASLQYTLAAFTEAYGVIV